MALVKENPFSRERWNFTAVINQIHHLILRKEVSNRTRRGKLIILFEIWRRYRDMIRPFNTSFIFPVRGARMKTLSSWQVGKLVFRVASKWIIYVSPTVREGGWLSKVLSSRCRGLNLVFTLCCSTEFRVYFYPTTEIKLGLIKLGRLNWKRRRGGVD